MRSEYSIALDQTTVYIEEHFASHFLESKLFPTGEEIYRYLAGYSYPGKKPTRPENVAFGITREIQQKSGYSELLHQPIYSGVNKMIIVVDDNREEVDAREVYEVNKFGGGSVSTERVAGRISLEQLQRICNGKKVTIGFLAGDSFKGEISIEAKKLKPLKAFADSIPAKQPDATE